MSYKNASGPPEIEFSIHFTLHKGSIIQVVRDTSESHYAVGSTVDCSHGFVVTRG